MDVSRNSPCSCGSGRKFKRCCLDAAASGRAAARAADAVAERIQRWSLTKFEPELRAALEEFAGPGRALDEDEIDLFATWFHSDRELASGGTPAERYASRPELSGAERGAAARIAAARLALLRVIACEPGRSMLLEDVQDGRRIAVRSTTVSRDAVRWDLLLGRPLEGDPAILWGATRIIEASEEPELLAELERRGGGHPSRLSGADALGLIRFLPVAVEPSLFTLAGDPVVEGTGTWTVGDVHGACRRLRALGGLRRGEPLAIDITVRRETLVADRPALPRGAVVIECGSVDGDDADVIRIAGLWLERDQLRVEAMSEAWLDAAIAIVEEDFGDIAAFARREVVPIEQRLERHRSASAPDQAAPPSASERRLIGRYMTARMRTWVDEPLPQLDGCTPRQGAAGPQRAEVVRLVRNIENGAERARRRGEPFADVAWLWDELGLAEASAA
ncbi:MAG: SEC-C domain-containing protein [Solirubrobacteraceae bacterium]